MTNKYKFKVLLTILLLGIALYFLYPSIRLIMMDEQTRKANPQKVSNLKKKAINLGLDLQGGMHLVLEIDKEKLPDDVKKSPIDEALQIIRNRVNQFGVSEPVIQKEGEERIIVELPGVQNPERAKELIQQTALLEFKLLGKAYQVRNFIDNLDTLLAANPGLMQPGGTKPEISSPEETTAVEEAKSTAEESMPSIDSVQEEKARKAEATMPTDSATKKALKESTEEMSEESLLAKRKELKGLLEQEDTSSLAQETGRENPFTSLVNHRKQMNMVIVPKSNVPQVKRILENVDLDEILPKKLEVAWSSQTRANSRTGQEYKTLYLLHKDAELTGRYLDNASFQFSQSGMTAGSPIVTLKFDEKGTETFSQVTGANLQKKLAVVLDGVVYTAPKIQTKIRRGQARITGIQDADEARKIEVVLRAGALPAPLQIIEERTVGPSLGRDSINKSFLALIIGAILVIAFVLIYYMGSGLVAICALVFNLIFLMAIMALLDATLTLPGIAGIILTIGMAVDANVLIFEMIREELHTGKTIRTAIDTGYSRAFTTILDANITTILIAIILYNFGTGPIKGFATTLGFGLVCSMFNALVVTRLIFDYYVMKFRPQKLSI